MCGLDQVLSRILAAPVSTSSLPSLAALVEVTATDSLSKTSAWTSLRKPKLDSKIDKGLRFDVIVCTACKRGLHAANC